MQPTKKKAYFNLAPTESGYQEIINEMTPFMPSLKTNKNYHHAVGTRPYTSDFTPFIGKLEPQLFVANGLGASGLTTGPYVGKVLAELATGFIPELDLGAFDPSKYIRPF